MPDEADDLSSSGMGEVKSDLEHKLTIASTPIASTGGALVGVVVSHKAVPSAQFILSSGGVVAAFVGGWGSGIGSHQFAG